MNNLKPEEAPSLWDVIVGCLSFHGQERYGFQLKLLTFIGEKFGTQKFFK